MTQLTVVQIDDSSDKTISGVIAYDRSIGGTLLIPAGAAFPVSPEAGELFFNTSSDSLFRRDDANASWVEIGGGGVASQVTNDSSVAGATVADALDTLDSDKAEVTSTAPVNVTRSAAVVGVSTEAARADHKHDIDTATALDLEAGGSSAEGVSTALARADHVHRIVDPTTEVSATNSVSTSSTTPLLLPGMTVTPGEGTYIVSFSAYGLHTNNNARGVFGVYVNGVLQAQSERIFGGKFQTDDADFPIHCQCKVTVGVGQAVEVRYNRDSGSGSIFVFARSLILTRVDD